MELNREYNTLLIEKKDYEDKIKMLEAEESTLFKCKEFLENELLTQEMKEQFNAKVRSFWDEHIKNNRSTIE